MPSIGSGAGQPFEYNGWTVHPTVNSNGTDAGGARVTVNGIEYRLTRGGHFFTKGLDTDTNPWQDPEQFMASTATALEALKRFQDYRAHHGGFPPGP